MPHFRSRLRSNGLGLSVLLLSTSPMLAQAADTPAMKPAQGQSTSNAGSANGVGKSPMEGTGETGNGRVINGTAGSGGTPPPGTLDKNSAGSVEGQ